MKKRPAPLTVPAPDRSQSGLPLGYERAGDEARTMGFGPMRKPPSGQQDDRLVCDASESHVLVVAPTGAGKGRNIIIPTLLHDPSPAIVLDIKGEAAAVTAKHRREVMGHEVVVIDPWTRLGPNTGRFNPLSLLREDSPALGDDAFALAALLTPPQSSPREPFWNERGEALIAGLMAHVATSPSGNERTIGRVHSLLHADDLVYSLALLLDTEGERMNPFARAQISSLVSLSADQTRSGIVSTAHSLFRAFASPAVQDSLRDGLDAQGVIEGRPQTIYLVVPPEKLVSHASYLRVVLASLIGLITQRTRRPKRPTVLLVDEAAQLGPMPQLRQAITLTRGYGVRAALFLQSLAQLRSLFPSDHEVLAENCGTIVSFGHVRPSMCEGVARIMGDTTDEALLAMGAEELAVKVGRAPTRILRRIDYLRDQPFCGRASPNPMFEEP